MKFFISSIKYILLSSIFIPVLCHNMVIDFPGVLSDYNNPLDSFEFVDKGFGEISLIPLNSWPKVQVEELILKKFPPHLKKNVRKILAHTLEISHELEVDPFWVLAVMWAESSFHFASRSSVGARGLMQIMPQTARVLVNFIEEKRYLRPLSLIKIPFKRNNQPNHNNFLFNIELGIIYLKHLFDYFDDNYLLATVAYNMGPGWVKFRMENGLPVGKRNIYLSRVKRFHGLLTKQIGSLII